MNHRENIKSLYRRCGYEFVPVFFNLCPSLVEEYIRQTGDKTGNYADYYNFSLRSAGEFLFKPQDKEIFKSYYGFELRPGSKIDDYGVGHMPGSEAAKHMTEMVNPMKNFSTLEQMKDYPFPEYDFSGFEAYKNNVKELQSRGFAVYYSRECTVWEMSWYIRGMENLMCDMLTDDEMATYILDRITDLHELAVCTAAKAGVDMIFLGDDIGMQRTIMMRKELYNKWIQPRLKRIISSIKNVNPDIIVQYHSCGYIEPLIDDLIDAGIDVLNPVQPECMDFKEIYMKYGDRLSFNGTLGTQKLIPFGTPEEIKAETYRNLDIAGKSGGLLPCPTHLLEPEVPWENIMAYLEACQSYKG